MEESYIDIDTVSSVLGVSKATLRYWESEGLISASRGSNNYRHYGSRDIIDIGDVALLRSVGVPVRDITSIMAMNPQELEVYCLHLSDRLNRRIAELLESQGQLNRKAGLCRELERGLHCEVVPCTWQETGVEEGISCFDIHSARDYGRYLKDPYSRRYVLYYEDSSAEPLDGWILSKGEKTDRLLYGPASDFSVWYRCLLKVRSDDRSVSNLDECLEEVRKKGAVPSTMVARYLLDAHDGDFGAKTSFYQLFVADASCGRQVSDVAQPHDKRGILTLK